MTLSWKEVLEEMNRDLDMKVKGMIGKPFSPLKLTSWSELKRRIKAKAAPPEVKSTEDEWKDISK